MDMDVCVFSTWWQTYFVDFSLRLGCCNLTRPIQAAGTDVPNVSLRTERTKSPTTLWATVILPSGQKSKGLTAGGGGPQ